MKKITLGIAAMIMALSMNAQTIYFEDDFQDGEISDWTLLDEDGDGFNFTAYDPSTAGNGERYHLSSASYDLDTQTALTPNNYSISPAIDVSGATTIQLDYMAGGQDPDFSAENYTVYVSTGNTIADFMDSSISVSFSENLGDDPNAAGAFVERSLDASALAGANTIYVAFRHHDVTDEFILNFDDVVVSDGNLGTEGKSLQNLTHHINNNILSIKSNTAIESLRVFNILGQQIATQEVNAQNTELNVSPFKTGVYLAQVQTEGKNQTFKFIKK